MTPLLIANWKMQLSVGDSLERLRQLRVRLDDFRDDLHVAVCPSFPALPVAADILSDSSIRLGAQDAFWTDRGPFTGQVSPADLRAIGVHYVLLGHSERRQLGETDDMIGRKMVAAVGHGMMPVLCVGETAAERSDGRHELVVRRQLTAALRSMPPAVRGRRLSIAYEPVWAIGSGEPARPEQALEMKAVIDQTVVDLYSAVTAAESFRVLYGGSVTADNICDYVRPTGFSGALAGTASLEVDSFVTMIEAVNQCFRRPT